VHFHQLHRVIARPPVIDARFGCALHTRKGIGTISDNGDTSPNAAAYYGLIVIAEIPKEILMYRDLFNHLVSAGVGLAFTASVIPLVAQKSATSVKNIVLVHGAFADGTSWAKVIPLLEQKGYHVVAVQNPLTSLAEDVAATKRIVALQDGPVILVGHSWGGVVITQAGDDPKVAGLVYVAAYAPDMGQSANDASGPFGVTEGQKQIRVDAFKYASLTETGIVEDFAQGLPMAERKLVAAVQGQSYGPMFDEKLTVAAWKTRPSWVIVSTNDRMLPPSMEKANVEKLKAHGTTLQTCHVAMLQDPDSVVRVIDEAAREALTK
jgi:pimeloyl-ACP methyl ester carboxylesterase